MPSRSPLARRLRAQRLRRALAYAGVVVAWAASIALGAVLDPPAWLHAVALFVHLASLVLGLGAVLVIEWHGLLWATRWSSLREVRQADRTLILPIWVGLSGLLASGALLHPELESPATAVKLAAVLVLTLNGVALTRLTADLGRLPAELPFARLPRAVRTRYLASAVVSQLAWWTAIVIGLANTTSR